MFNSWKLQQNTPSDTKFCLPCLCRFNAISRFWSVRIYARLFKFKIIMKSPCQWFVYRPTASDSLESGQQQHLRPWNSLHIEKIFKIQRRTSYRNFFDRFDWNSTRTTSPSRLKVGSIEGPTQIVTSITYSCMQCKMQLNCVTRPSWLMTSEIKGDLDPDIPPKNFN